MKQFYETYSEDQTLAPLWRTLPWTHNLVIFSRCKSAEERVFYLKLSNSEKYTSRELKRQINACAFERTMTNQAKLSAVLRELQPQLTNAFKDSYILEFLGISENHQENELQKELIKNIRKFILELGKEFLYIGEEYKIYSEIGANSYFIANGSCK